MRTTIVFLQIPVVIGVTESNEPNISNGKILPGMVCAYHPSPNGGTYLYYTTGALFETSLSLSDYEKAVEMFYREVQKNGQSALKIVTAKDIIQ